MTVKRRCVLAISVRSRCISYVVFNGRRLTLWKMSHAAADGPKKVESFVRVLIATHEPDVVICEEASGNPYKGNKTKALMRKVAQAIGDEPAQSIVTVNKRRRKNMYLTAIMLAARFPEIAEYLPQSRKFYETEHRRVGYIEALSLALTVIDDEPI